MEILSAAHNKNKIKNYNRLSRKIVRVNRRTRERAVEEHDAQKDLKFTNHPTCTPFLYAIKKKNLIGTKQQLLERGV